MMARINFNNIEKMNIIIGRKLYIGAKLLSIERVGQGFRFTFKHSDKEILCDIIMYDSYITEVIYNDKIIQSILTQIYIDLQKSTELCQSNITLTRLISNCINEQF